DDVTLLDCRAGYRIFHRCDENVADGRVAAAGTAEDLDTQDLARARIIGDLESAFLLDHRSSTGYFARSTTSTSRQRLSLHIGRVSCTRTRSPGLSSLLTSCT